MIMKRIFLLVAVSVMSVTAAFAAKDKSGIEYQNLRGPFVTNPFGDNWFLSVGAGVNTWFRPSTLGGEEYKGFAQFTPIYQIGFGKMLHPYWGIRFQGNYGQIKDDTSLFGMFTKDYDAANPSDKYRMQFNYWDVEADLLFHFSNAVGGYKEARFYNAILFAGMGYIQAYGDDSFDNHHVNNELAVNFGWLSTFRLAKGLDLYAELKANVVRQGLSAETVRYNNTDNYYIGAEGFGMIPSATIGLTYKFKDRKFYTAQTAIDNAVASATRTRDGRISTLENELAAAERRAAQYKAEAERTPETIVKTETEVEVVQVPLAVFFKKGDAKLTEFEMLNIRYVADVIKKNPEKTYTIIAMADKETGSHEFNQKLSEQRAEVVRKALVENGVNNSKLQVKALGDRTNPFELNEMNRVVIIE